MPASARRRVGYVLSCEQFAPTQIVQHAVLAEQAGFEQAWISDHFHPWMDNQGHAGHPWVLLGAIGQRTRRLTLGTAVTCPSYRYRPPEVAQGFATLGSLYPGRIFLGLGGGEALNELPTGGGWGPYRERADRLAEATRLIQQLWTGAWVTSEGPYYPVRNVKIYDLPPQPIPIYLAASGPKSARLAGQLADGWITVGSAVLDDQVRGAFNGSSRAAGKDQASLPILVEHYMVVGGRAEAEEAARYWRFIASPWDLLNEPDPREILRKAEQASLEEVYGRWTVSDDPQAHAAAIERYFAAGVTDVYVHSGQLDQARVVDFFGKRVLPLLRQG